MTFLDFFAGVGGFRRGMELAGHTCVGFCEFDKFAVASYTSMHLITEEQRKHLAEMPMNKRQKEILKNEYRNDEYYCNDIRSIKGTDLPHSDCWCFGAPCQSFSVLGLRKGLDGESGLIREIFRLLEETEGNDKPEWLIYENVKGMLSSNDGWDFAAILVEMDRLGYDAEWQTFDSADWGVPQHRERVYVVGHFRRYGFREILPVKGTDGPNRIRIVGHREGYKRNTQTFSPDGTTETLSTCQGGGREHHVAIPIDVIGHTRQNGNHGEDRERVLSGLGVSPTLRATDYKEPYKIAIPVGDIGNEGYVTLDDGSKAYAIWYEKWNSYIVVRKITPRESFRLQGWTDDYFEKAQFVNSDSQLYKQAGNGVTVPVVAAIAAKLTL